MNRKLEFFLTGNFKPDLFAKFKKDVSLIKFEAEKLDTSFECYHPYYLLVYSYLKKLIEEGIVENDKFARGNFHKIWVLAEETDDLRITIQNQHLPLTEYGKAVKEGRNNTEVYTTEKYQYERNIKRLELILESIRFQAKEAKMKNVGIAGRVAFFYHTLYCQDPCFTVAMNKLWIKLNHDLYDKKYEWIHDTRRLLPDVVKRTFMTDMKCLMCMFGTGQYATEPDFYYHSILSHSSLRLKCNEPKCEFKALNRIRMDNHLAEQHPKIIGTRKGNTCRGCGRWHLTLAKVSKCEEGCVKSNTFKKLSVYYWEKYYLIWSGQVKDDFTLEQYFFPELPVDSDKEKIVEPEVDEGLFNVSFGSDFECSWDDPDKKEGGKKIEEEDNEKKLEESEQKMRDEGDCGKKEEKDDRKEDENDDKEKMVQEVNDEVDSRNMDVLKSSSPVKIMTAKEALEKEWGSLATKLSLKRKAPAESAQLVGVSHVEDIRKELAEQRKFFKSKIAKLDDKMDQLFSMVKTIKKCIEKK